MVSKHDAQEDADDRQLWPVTAERRREVMQSFHKRPQAIPDLAALAAGLNADTAVKWQAERQKGRSTMKRG